jgi:hypothetical protein
MSSHKGLTSLKFKALTKKKKNYKYLVVIWFAQMKWLSFFIGGHNLCVVYKVSYSMSEFF